MISGFVYVLSMNNGKYYVGSTTDLERRLTQHQKGYVKATKFFIPVKLVYFRSYITLQEARQKEYWLKKQKDREQIEKFVQGM